MENDIELKDEYAQDDASIESVESDQGDVESPLHSSVESIDENEEVPVRP
jgi:hypothetical protein